jgi:ankyrin repeat protein
MLLRMGITGLMPRIILRHGISLGVLLALAIGGAARSADNIFALAKKGTAEQINTAISFGAKVTVQDKNGDLPLHIAAAANPDPDAIKVLVRGFPSPLELARIAAQKELADAEKDYKNAVKDWTKANTSYNKAYKQRDADGMAGTQARFAMEKAQKAIDKAKRERIKAEDIDIPNARRKVDNLSDPGPKSRKNPSAYVEPQFVAQADGFVNAKDGKGRTALHLAAAYNPNPEVIRALIAVKVRMTPEGTSGWTPLHYAARLNKNPAMITALIAAGADVEAKAKNGNTPLMVAKDNENSAAIIQSLMNVAAIAVNDASDDDDDDDE